MGKGLGMRVIAEGVETRTQAKYLHARRCDDAQGDYFSCPVPPEGFEGLLRARRGEGLTHRRTRRNPQMAVSAHA
jgi:EAL domain-containing protein (putative c-di-GMP-specific phosphodiesterase class I)